MPSQYSQNLRIELVASGEQGNTWGNTTNNNLGTLIEQAISGYRSISTVWSGNACTLTTLNGANDQARNMFLEIPSGVSLSAEGQLTAPTVPKMYVIKNASSGGFAVRIKTGSSATTCLIPNGTTKVVVCDGTEFYEATTAAANFYIANAPTLASQATNKSYVDTQDDLRLKRDGTQNMTGELVLSAGTAPVNALGAVSSQYVGNTFLPLTGGTLSGGLTLPSSVGGLTTWSAVPKTYVDSITVSSLNSGITVGGSVATGVQLTLNPATASNLGGIKVGSGLSVAGDGTLSATGTSGVTAVTGTSPILVNGASGSAATGNITLAMAANAYYPYSSNPAGYVTSSGSVNFATSAGSATTASTATNATNASNLGGVAASGYVVKTGSTMTGALNVQNSSSPSNYIRLDTIFDSGSGVYYPSITSINTGGPTYAPIALLQYSTVGTYQARLVVGTGGAITITNLSAGGTVSAGAGTGTLTVSSDQNLKVADGFIENGLAKVDTLLPRYFYWKDEEGNANLEEGRQLGFYAQEVQAVSPEASPTGQGIYDRAIIAILVKAVQELKAEVEALKGV